MESSDMFSEWWKQHEDSLMSKIKEICETELRGADLDDDDFENMDLGDELSDASFDIEQLLLVEYDGDVDDDIEEEAHNLARSLTLKLFREIIQTRKT